MGNPIAPKFKHDCDKCRFLGRLKGQDAYVCRSSIDADEDSFILRYGDEGWAYSSINRHLLKKPNPNILDAMSMLLIMGDQDG